jgi:hypothetical protein
MAYFQTKNPNLGKFWKVLQSKMLVYFMVVWYMFPRFGMLYQDKSGNPGHGLKSAHVELYVGRPAQQKRCDAYKSRSKSWLSKKATERTGQKNDGK